jgi:SAM-dependent methyltransferase
VGGASAGDEPACGRSFYDDETVFSHYSTHREWSLNPHVVMEEPALLEALGNVSGARVLDLGCGDAALGRVLLEAGCRSYHGIDASERMIERATETLNGTSGTVALGTIEAFAAPPDSLDLVVSRVVFHYVEDIGPALRACHTCLSNTGRLVFSIVHPVITSHDARATGEKRTNWIVDDYFVRGPRVQRWLGGQVIWFHRTTEDYIAELNRAGFRLVRLSECEPRYDRFGGDEAEFQRRRRIPLFLLLAAGKV